MTQVVVRREINAPPELIFRFVSQVENLPSQDPDVIRVEFLTEQRTGVGTRFRETRRMKKSELQTELLVTEWEESARVRMVADSHGTIWDTTFTVEPTAGGGRLTIAMDARGQGFPQRIMNALFRGMYRRGIEKHLDALKGHCEAAA